MSTELAKCDRDGRIWTRQEPDTWVTFIDVPGVGSAPVYSSYANLRSEFGPLTTVPAPTP